MFQSRKGPGCGRELADSHRTGLRLRIEFRPKLGQRMTLRNPDCLGA